VRGVREGLASLGVCWDATDHAGLQTRPYRRDTLCVVVPRGHPLARRSSVRFLDTLDYEHVSLPVNSAVQLMLQRQAGERGRSVKHRVVVSNFEAALRVVRAGLAISLVPREVVDATALGALHLLPLAEPWAERRFILCYRDAPALTPAAQLLVDHLASLAPP
jgi:DNA-binding transcriptional LysR family regulator